MKYTSDFSKAKYAYDDMTGAKISLKKSLGGGYWICLTLDKNSETKFYICHESRMYGMHYNEETKKRKVNKNAIFRRKISTLKRYKL